MDRSLPGSSVHGILQQEYWSGLPFPSPGDLPNPRITPASLASPAVAGRFFTSAPPGKPNGLLSHKEKKLSPFESVSPHIFFFFHMGFPGGSEVKVSASNVGDWRSIPGSRRSPGEGNGNPLQHSCLKSHGRRSLIGYSPWGRKESDTTERLHTLAQITYY